MKANVNKWLQIRMMMKSVFISMTVLLFLIGVLPRHAYAVIPAIERNALVALYNSTDGDNWTDNSGWKDPPLDADGFAMPGTENTWYGITCDAGNTHVIGFSLLYNNLTGNIPSEIGNLTELLELNLASNQLIGSIPTSLTNLININNLWINFNALYTEDDALRTFLNNKDTNWETSQTVAPKNIIATPLSDSSILITWTPVTYTLAGFYRVFYSISAGGPYTLYDTTTDQSASQMEVIGLTSETTYYFVIQTHTNLGPANPPIDSEQSTEVSATTTAIGYQIADNFVFPVYGYIEDDGCLNWGGYNSEYFPGKRHVADDYCCALETEVKAVAKGRVKYTLYDPNNSTGYGWYGLIIIEHTLEDNSKVCSIYGHVKPVNIAAGTDIDSINTKIGEVLNYPPSSNHIHFGIYNGEFGANEGVYPSWCHGYLPENEWPGQYLDPVAFIESHQCSDTPQNLSLARIEGEGSVYWLQNEKAYHVLSLQIIKDMSSLSGWSHICDYPPSILEIIPPGHLQPEDTFLQGPDFIGTGLSSDDLLIQLASDPKVYLVENGKRRWITSEAVFNQLGYDWNDVIEVTETILNSIPKGNNILSRIGLPWIDLLLNDDVPGEKTLRVPARYPTIQAAINAASNGDTVLVANGTYTGTGNKNLDFKGKAISVQSESGPDNCIIDCQLDGRGFYFYNGEGSDSVVDGFTIINASDSGIFLNVYSSPTISNCTITNNTGQGAGIACWWYSSPSINKCRITGNTAIEDGGGISCYWYSSPNITNCVITGNTALNTGGGFDIYAYSSPTIINCTVSQNQAEYGGGISLIYESSATITNCILWGNSATIGGTEIALFNNDSLTNSYSNVQGGEAAAYVMPGCTLNWSDGNIDSDPLFVSNSNFYLKSGSPCIDTGTAEVSPNTDIEGISRPQGIGYDMGAYEFH